MSENKITAGVESIGPEEAKKLLATQARNRPLRKAKVLRFASQMRAGKWQVNGEPIIISADEELFDGQHRLQAIIEFGKPVLMMVVRGVAGDTRRTMNTGTSRTAADVLYMYDERATPTDARITSTAYRWLYKYLHKSSMFSGGRDQNPKEPPREPTPYELLDLAIQHPKMRDAVVWARGKSSDVPGFRDGPMAFLYYVCVFQRSEKVGKKFFGQLVSGADLKANDPCYKLRQQMISLAMTSDHGDPVGYLARAIKAWNATRSGKPIELLIWRRAEGFPDIL